MSRKLISIIQFAHKHILRIHLVSVLPKKLQKKTNKQKSLKQKKQSEIPM